MRAALKIEFFESERMKMLTYRDEKLYKVEDNLRLMKIATIGFTKNVLDNWTERWYSSCRILELMTVRKPLYIISILKIIGEYY